MKTILFICTGNVCRSPMAEGIFRQATQGRGEYRVMSAGLGAVEGAPPSAYAVQAAQELGINISGLRSQMVTADLVEQADYIFGMTHSHIDTVMALYPQAAEKTFLVREFDETLDSFEKDISDPIGGSYEVYLNCRDQLEQGIVSLLGFIDQGQAAPGQGGGRSATIAIGPDHGGYELKEALKQHLEKRGMSVADFGAANSEASDYPDYAQAVAQSVAQHKAQLGVLICSTGIGMSIAANKVSGVRAALVGDVSTAALARQHNNANVLCLAGKTTKPEEARRIVDVFLDARFEGGRHERRVKKMEIKITPTDLRLSAVDPEIAAVIEHERQRQQENIELIASENLTSPAVMEAQRA